MRAVADAIGYPAAGLGILIESAGIPFPGEAMLLAVSAYAAAGHLDIRLVALCGAAGAVAGADLGYFAGHHGGRPFVERFGHFFRINPASLSRAELFFSHHGPWAVVAARFVIGLRTWFSVLAGMSGMPFLRFQAYSALGGLAWAVVISAIGYFLGANFSLVERLVTYLGLGGLAAVIVAVLGLWLLRRRAAQARQPRSR